ncbi:hypothetical protein ACVIHD_001975 [Bradyrhizobium embrapense]
MHHLERVAALDDVDARQRTPGAADRVEGATATGLELGNAEQFVLDDAFSTLERLVREVLQCKAAERQRHAAAHAVAPDVDQFERAAAEVADDAVRIVHARDDAERRQLRFARSGENLDLGAADALCLGDEVRSVLGVAAGRGRDRVDAADLLDPAQRAKAAQRGERLVDGIGCEQAGALHLASEPAQCLLVEDGDEAARHRLVDHETNRVRADIDHSDAGSALPRPLHRKAPLRRWLLTLVATRETAR